MSWFTDVFKSEQTDTWAKKCRHNHPWLCRFMESCAAMLKTLQKMPPGSTFARGRCTVLPSAFKKTERADSRTVNYNRKNNHSNDKYFLKCRLTENVQKKKARPFNFFWIEVDFFSNFCTFCKQMRQSVTTVVRNSRHTTATSTTTMADELIVCVSLKLNCMKNPTVILKSVFYEEVKLSF